MASCFPVRWILHLLSCFFNKLGGKGQGVIGGLRSHEGQGQPHDHLLIRINSNVPL